ncbi:hypothetical protein, partial [Candidatus Sodalis sp. SoCistrobi]|uniref:hypothetical protein n=1 Tax=Candidatus Sodalis sp. SoCistrobi TaxID=1922216 RepID=UPI001C2785B4
FRQMDHATQRLETCYEPIHVDVWRTNLQLSDGAIYTKKFTDPRNVKYVNNLRLLVHLTESIFNKS